MVSTGGPILKRSSISGTFAKTGVCVPKDRGLAELLDIHWLQIVKILVAIVLAAISILLIVFNDQIVKAVEPTGQKIKACALYSSALTEQGL
jgi:hypothetical protein